MISAVVLTKNSSETLPKTLKSLSFCDEVIVIDDYSNDSTLTIAKKHGSKLFKRKLNNDFSAQRNFGLSKAKHDWVLFIDSDEAVSKELEREIKNEIKNTNENAFYIRRKDFWMGREIKNGETDIKILRLARKNSGRWRRNVHEFWDAKGKAYYLKNYIYHYPHSSLSKFISDITRYSSLHSLENKKEGKNPSILKIISFPIIKFKVNFILKRGYMDGVHGFVIAGIMSFHSFLSWSNLWLRSRKK